MKMIMIFGSKPFVQASFVENYCRFVQVTETFLSSSTETRLFAKKVTALKGY